MTTKLIKYNHYSRKDVHNIFSPNTVFSSGSGNWGIRGIIKIPNTISDYIFYVTYGQTMSGYDFDESIDNNGVLMWQSSPSLTRENRTIKDLIAHDTEKSNIYLFLRTNKNNKKYAYLGLLSYIDHDNEKDKPVFFKWQILDWDKNKAILALNDLKIKLQDSPQKNHEKHQQGLVLRKPPIFSNRNRSGKDTSSFHSKNVDFIGEAYKNSKLGNAGEDAVLEYEKKRLELVGHSELSLKVYLTRDTIGNTAKYDVHSYNEDGTDRFIEVKTTKGSENNQVFISEGEVSFSEFQGDNYYIYRVYNFDVKTGRGDFYIKKGSINRANLSALNYAIKI